jgi:hypothetical protein
MGSLGFTLADRLGARSNPCSVRGCSRTWLQMTGRVAKLGGRAGASEGDPTSSMCEPCREAYPKLVDAIHLCDRVGCEHVWTWPVGEQIEAFAANRPAPQRLCLDCESRLSSLADREIPCAVTGCHRHAVFTRRAQLIAGGSEGEPAPAPTMMCAPCANVYEKIKDRQITCGIQGCKQKWSWTRDAQIQDYAAGLPNEPPRRLCDACRTVFGAIADREVRCRTSGCKNTWTWPRETQLSSAVAGKPLPKAPHRMCQRCIDVYSATRDIERPCRRPGCKRTWTDKRGAQLARAVRGKTGDPYPHYCTECEKELGEMEDRQVPCKTEHCPGTWTWTAAQQLAAGVRPEVKVAPGASSPAGAGVALESGAHGDHTHGERHPDHLAHHPAHHSADLGPQVGLGASVGGPDGPNEDGDGDAHDDAHDAGHDDVLAADSSPAEQAAGHDPQPSAGPDGHEGHQPASRVGAVPGATTGKKRRRRKRRKEIRPPERRCEDCVTFLKDRKTREIPCVGCKTTIFWPPESQLQTHLGNWAEPTLCGACKRDLTEAARAIEREALRHGGVHAHLPEAPHGSPVAVAGALEHGPPDLVEETAPPEGAPPVLSAAIPSETILN